MSEDVYKPFDQDVASFGGYQYTTTTRRSSIYANRRYTAVTVETARLDGKSVVDVGCGDGTYTAALRDGTKATSILGIDPARNAVELAQQKFAAGRTGIAFRHGFARDLIAQGEHFDVAVYRGVIHHVADPAGEIADALTLADTVFFLEPNGSNPVLKLMERYSQYHVEHQERSYRMARMCRWIRQAGGEVEQAFYFGLVPFFAPDWLVVLGSSLEPIIERLPLARAVSCGQIAIRARSGRLR